jgi:hypothetical protein
MPLSRMTVMCVIDSLSWITKSSDGGGGGGGGGSTTRSCKVNQASIDLKCCLSDHIAAAAAAAAAAICSL